MYKIFGSEAIKFWYPDFKRTPSDLDIITRSSSFEVYGNSRKIELHWNESFQYVLDNNKHEVYVDPDFLYTIKVSHACYDIHWDKTMHDIEFLKSKGCKLDHTLFNLLLKDWEIRHGSKSHIKLKGYKQEFFNKNISRKFDHDELHKMLSINDCPMYKKILTNKDDVSVSKKKWDNLSYQEQLDCASEEAFVFAIERYSDYPPKIAVIKALKQLITSSTKGWFNLFLIENFDKLRYNNRDFFIKKYKEIVC